MKRLVVLAIAASSIATAAHAQVGIRFDFGPPPPRGSFWEGAPQSLAERIQIVDRRMQRLHNEGLIGPGEWVRDVEEFNQIRRGFDNSPRMPNGALYPREHNFLWNRLNNLSNRLHWQANLGY